MPDAAFVAQLPVSGQLFIALEAEARQTALTGLQVARAGLQVVVK